MEGINKTSQVSMQNLVRLSGLFLLFVVYSPPVQFSSYDPVKIRSHPGVRSDLFGRPLESALITDFFGGVSQAEVFPVIEESVNILPQMRDSFHDDQSSIANSRSVDTRAYSPDFNAPDIAFTTSGNDSPTWEVPLKELRKWASIAMVGSLVAWVSLAR